MSDLDTIMKELSGDDNERLLEIARFAELGMSASAVIHELRQPLTALSMALQMTLESAQNADPEIRNGIEEALLLSGKVDLLLNRARDFMRPSKGMGTLDLENVVTKVMSVFEWQLKRQSNVKMHYNIENGPVTIHGDESQIEQMVANLISNAIDAVREHPKGEVHLIVKRVDGVATIVIADNGHGVDSKIEEHIFEPFVSNKGATKGTGLGLYIVSKIASRHGAVCSFLHGDELAKLNIGDITTGVSVVFK